MIFCRHIAARKDIHLHGKIISDSTSDLTKELIDKLDISVIPLHILLGNDEYRDGIDITPDKILNGQMRIRQHLRHRRCLLMIQ